MHLCETYAKYISRGKSTNVAENRQRKDKKEIIIKLMRNKLF